MYKHFFKRLLDSFIAFVVLGILFIPLVISLFGFISPIRVLEHFFFKNVLVKMVRHSRLLSLKP